MTNWIWFRPEMVAQIEFTEWTVEDQLRHPHFIALLPGENPLNQVRE